MAQITVQITPADRPLMSFKVTVNDTDTVEQLKEDICSWNDILVEEQLLVYYTQILKDDQTLESYGITDNSKIQLSQ
jgi:hypothetical protein